MTRSGVRVPPPALMTVAHPSNAIPSRHEPPQGCWRPNDHGRNDRATRGRLRYLSAVRRNSRYDLVIDDGARLARVQCKTGRIRSGAIVFKTSSTYAHHRSPTHRNRDYRGQIDFFGVYSSETSGVYLIPIEAVGSSWQALLRVEAPQNNQRKGVRFAADYQVGTVGVPRLPVRRALRASSGAR